MDEPARLPPPLYAPSVVADAILFACANPRRPLYAGGGGLLSSMLGQVAPRLTDVIMEMTGTTLQQKPDDPGDATRQDNLHRPRRDALRSSQRVHARRSSIALEIQKASLPLLALAVFGAGAIAVHRLWSRRRR
jgi:hypothetical protein